MHGRLGHSDGTTASGAWFFGFQVSERKRGAISIQNSINVYFVCRCAKPSPKQGAVENRMAGWRSWQANPCETCGQSRGRHHEALRSTRIDGYNAFREHNLSSLATLQWGRSTQTDRRRFSQRLGVSRLSLGPLSSYFAASCRWSAATSLVVLIGHEKSWVAMERPEAVHVGFVECSAIDHLPCVCLTSSSAIKPKTSCSAIQLRTLSMTVSSASPPSMTSARFRKSRPLR